MKVCIYSIVALVVLGCVAYVSMPWVRTTLSEKHKELTSWTEEDKAADPLGYANFVEDQLRSDIKKLEQTRGDLASATSSIGDEVAKRTTQLEKAETLAGECAEVLKSGVFPVDFHGRTYNGAQQLRAQLSMILAQQQQNKALLAKLQEAYKLDLQKNQDLVLQLESANSELVMLESKKAIFKVGQLSTEGQALLTSVENVLAGNQKVFSNPVRTLDELLQDDAQAATQAADDSLVQEYLDNYDKEEAAETKSDAE